LKNHPRRGGDAVQQDESMITALLLLLLCR
jgi:hypothetical protein